jgi:hypothetical protein
VKKKGSGTIEKKKEMRCADCALRNPKVLTFCAFPELRIMRSARSAIPVVRGAQTKGFEVEQFKTYPPIPRRGA